MKVNLRKKKKKKQEEEEGETIFSRLQVAQPFWTSSRMTRPPTGEEIAACCYGANNKLEEMHSSSQDEDGSWCNPHAHFTLKISTDVNMVENMSHLLC